MLVVKIRNSAKYLIRVQLGFRTFLVYAAHIAETLEPLTEKRIHSSESHGKTFFFLKKT